MAGTHAKKKKTTAGDILRTLLLILIIIAIVLVLFNFTIMVKNRESLPMPFGLGFAVVLSGSMEPVFSVDDLIIVKRASDVNVGDIVVFDTGRSLVVHRVVERNGDEVITKGDANNAQDTPITMNDIKGTYLARIPHGGTAVDIIKSPAGIAVIAVAAVLLLFISYVREKRDEEEEKRRCRKEKILLRQKTIEDYNNKTPEEAEYD